MLNVFLKGHDHRHEVEELLKVFINKSEICFINNRALVNNQSLLLISELIFQSGHADCIARLMYGNSVILDKNFSYSIDSIDDLQKNKIIKRGIKLSIYDICSQFYEKAPQWGTLTGIRPTKIVHELLDQGYDISTIYSKLNNEYRIQPNKIDLLVKIANIQRHFIAQNQEERVSLYISIPFCPTRCLYCSFPSNPLDYKGRDQISDYLYALQYEIKEIGKTLKNLGKKIETLYIGGGTPTTLSPMQLDELLFILKENMDMDDIKEITVEAGRPDTITFDKLAVLKAHGINRISINPQTMNPNILKSIGRLHSVEDIFKAYEIARKLNFKTINMDLIIGLPGESLETFKNTMDEIQKMKPENITVHTLAIKRSSKLREDIKNYQLPDEKEANKMLKTSNDYAEAMGLIPYYLYRQKYMVGNLENIGYCISGHECIYNIQIMQEKQSIIAFGAGGVSKIFYQNENRLERIPNVTNIEQYILRVREMIERKRNELEKQV